jgi:hypothetical protein
MERRRTDAHNSQSPGSGYLIIMLGLSQVARSWYRSVTVTVHSIAAAVLPPARLRAALCGPERSARHPLDAVEETGAAERPADAFRLPQPLEQDGIGLLVEKIRKVRIAFADRSKRRKPVGTAPQVRAHARPRPVLRPPDETRPNRIERYIAQRRRKVIFVAPAGCICGRIRGGFVAINRWEEDFRGKS